MANIYAYFAAARDRYGKSLVTGLADELPGGAQTFTNWLTENVQRIPFTDPSNPPSSRLSRARPGDRKGTMATDPAPGAMAEPGADLVISSHDSPGNIFRPSPGRGRACPRLRPR
ncbi:hypothetical protein GCM10027456_76980 [Kineosporia babensis]